MKKLLSILFLIIYSASFAQKSDFEKNLFWFELGSNRKYYEGNLFTSRYDDFNSFEYKNKSFKHVLDFKLEKTFLFFDENNTLQKVRLWIKDRHSPEKTLELLNKIEHYFGKPLTKTIELKDYDTLEKTYSDGYKIIEFTAYHYTNCDCFELIIDVFIDSPFNKSSLKYESFEW